MPEASFPKPITEVIATLADLFRHQDRMDIVELLENARARFDLMDYDNWNGGTYTWALRLEVPVALFAPIEPRLASVEKTVVAKLAHFIRPFPNDRLGEVSILPLASGVTAVGLRIAPSEIEVRRLWPEGQFRLFLSHVSKHRLAVENLKSQLELRGVAAFVAHSDIEPSLEWQREMELGLRSMDALAALITPDFHASPWTDQEVGWALGRGVLVIPVRLGVDPYGFMGKVQGIPGSLESPHVLAESIVNALLINPQTHGRMRHVLVKAFCGASSYLMALKLCPLIAKIEDLSEEEKAALRNACVANDQVSRAHKVPETIRRVIGEPSAPDAQEGTVNVPF